MPRVASLRSGNRVHPELTGREIYSSTVLSWGCVGEIPAVDRDRPFSEVEKFLILKSSATAGMLWTSVCRSRHLEPEILIVERC